MATGPEHYRDAEHLLFSQPVCSCPVLGCVHHQTQMAAAQVHATLSLAAATGLTHTSTTWADWNQVAGPGTEARA